MRMCELRQKEVINICDGKRIGFVVDVELDLKEGCVIALIVPGPCRLWGLLGRDQEYIVPFCDIRSVGPDVILVEIEEEKCLQKG